MNKCKRCGEAAPGSAKFCSRKCAEESIADSIEKLLMVLAHCAAFAAGWKLWGMLH